MFLEFLDLKTALLIAHVFGAILGAGGAFASDSIFLSTMRDGRISKDEMRFIKLGGRLVWTGLGLLILSGAFLFALDPQGYLASGKFLAKMSVILIILANGVVFHLFHIPRMERNLDRKLASSPDFVRKSYFLVASGAISMASWVTTVVLGMLKSIPHDYEIIMAIYAALALAGICGALLMRKVLLRV